MHGPMIRLPIECKFQRTKVDKTSASFESVASVFGNVDAGGDIVEPGAFTESLKQRRPKGIR